jgi:acetyltransferase-like isoleucine patch superfamily enzyme
MHDGQQLPPWPHTSYGRHSYGGTVVYHQGDPPSRLTVGAYTSIAEGAQFMIGGNHRPEWASMFPFRVIFDLPGAGTDGHPASKGDITIGSDVWIGRDAMVLSGVTVGHGSVIGARAVVAKDVEPYSVVAGSPAVQRGRRLATTRSRRSSAWRGGSGPRMSCSRSSTCSTERTWMS